MRALAFTATAFFPGNALAENPWVDSVVVGALAHNVVKSNGYRADANVELRFNLPLGLPEHLEVLPTIGGTAHFGDGASLGYAGATLRYQHDSGIYAEGFLGLAAHTADTPADPDEANLGCEYLFREAGEIGYRWRQHQIGAHIAHYSHGRTLCDQSLNEGLTQIGMRYGYRF